MKMNLGDRDRTARVMAGAALAWVAFAKIPAGNLRMGLALFCVWLLATCVSGWDPLYALFRISTVEGPRTGAPTRIK